MHAIVVMSLGTIGFLCLCNGAIVPAIVIGLIVWAIL
jgi:hypothetical protein